MLQSIGGLEPSQDATTIAAHTEQRPHVFLFVRQPRYPLDHGFFEDDELVAQALKLQTMRV